jgi:hypothetical protein
LDEACGFRGDQVRLVSFGALVVSSIDALGFFCAKQAQEAGFDALAEPIVIRRFL